MTTICCFPQAQGRRGGTGIEEEPAAFPGRCRAEATPTKLPAKLLPPAQAVRDTRNDVLGMEVVVVADAGLAMVVVDTSTTKKAAMKLLLMVILENLTVVKMMSRDLLVGVIHMLTILVDQSVVDNMVVSAMVRMEMLNAHHQSSLSDIVVLGVGMNPNVMDLDVGTGEHPLMKLCR